MSVLNKIRIEREGEKPRGIYRRIYDVQVVSIPKQTTQNREGTNYDTG